MSRRSIGRYLAGAALFVLSGYYIKQIVGKQRHANSRGSKTNRPPFETISTVENNKHPSEGEHRTAEQLYWRKSITATWIAVLVAGGAAIFSYKAFQEARRQAEATEQSNRPWLSIKGVSISRLITTKVEVGMVVNLTIANYGNAPAVRVFGQGIVRRQNETLDNNDFFDEGRKYCLTVEYPEDYLGVVVMPNKDTSFDAGASRLLNDLAATQPDNEDGTSTLDEYLKETGLHVVGCVIYQGTNTTIHRSSFDFYIKNFDINRRGKIEGLSPAFEKDSPVYAD